MEKAQQVRKDKGDGHGYRCGRCGQPKRGHICPALTSGERREGENLVKRATALSAMASRKISVQQAAQALDKERKAKGSSSRGLKGKLAKMGSSRILNVAELFDTLDKAEPGPDHRVMSLLFGDLSKEQEEGILCSLGFTDPATARIELERARAKPSSPLSASTKGPGARVAPHLLLSIAESPAPNQGLAFLSELISRRGRWALI